MSQENNSEESATTPEPTQEQIEAAKNKEKLEKIANALNIPRINEDISDLRTEVQSVANNLTKLVNAINDARMQQPQEQQQQQQRMQSDDIPPEQKMLLLKDGIAGIADLVKAWKGTSTPPALQQQNDFQGMIMQSFAKMIQAKVDETIFSTYGTQIPVDQLQQVRQIQQQAANIVQPKPGFEK